MRVSGPDAYPCTPLHTNPQDAPPDAPPARQGHGVAFLNGTNSWRIVVSSITLTVLDRTP